VGSPGVNSDVQEAFYRREHARTVRLARLLTGSAGAAEDLAHAAFVRVHRHDALVDPSATLCVATVQVCRDWHRARRREALRIVSVTTSTRSLSVGAREVDAVLARLPYRRRAAVVLRHWLQMSDPEIARVLGRRPRRIELEADNRLRSHLTELADATPLTTPLRFDAERPMIL
jgi:DNA-directed RNA polymerase specialized sigma24 family protein